jgi:hypothetical protein
MSEPQKVGPRGRGTFYTSIDAYVLAREPECEKFKSLLVVGALTSRGRAYYAHLYWTMYLWISRD